MEKIIEGFFVKLEKVILCKFNYFKLFLKSNCIKKENFGERPKIDFKTVAYLLGKTTTTFQSFVSSY